MLFCSNLFKPPVPFSNNHYTSFIMCPKITTPSKKCKIPSASVTALKAKTSTLQSSIKTFFKKDLTSTDSNWKENTSGKYSNSSQHSFSHSNSYPRPVSCTHQGSYEIISQHFNFSNWKSDIPFSETSLIFSSPSKRNNCFKGITLLHSKQSDNSNGDNVSHCKFGLLITKCIDVNTCKLSGTFVPLFNCSRYDVARYKAKTPYLSDTQQKDLIKTFLFQMKTLYFLKEKEAFDVNGFRFELPWLCYYPTEDVAYCLSSILFGDMFPRKASRVKNLYTQPFRHWQVLEMAY